MKRFVCLGPVCFPRFDLNSKLTRSNFITHRDTLKENIDLIRNQRELREKQLQISTLQARIQDFEADQTAMKEANRKLVAEVERLTNEVGLLEQKIIHTESAATLATKDHLKVLEVSFFSAKMIPFSKITPDLRGSIEATPSHFGFDSVV